MLPRMNSIDLSDTTISGLIEAVDEAGQAILSFYDKVKKGNFRTKQDGSPVTEADLASDRILGDALSRLTPDIPVISEESFDGVFTLAPDATFWLVDPLDGTKEFLARTGEFTVNIGLIDHGRPVFGIIGIPTAEDIYIGTVGQGAWIVDPDGARTPVAARMPLDEGLTVVTSRYQGSSPEMADFLESYPVANDYRKGSSYKFCDIASGRADLYPCLNRISEWDTAAGHALVVAAGGALTALDGGELLYGKEGLRNPPYIVTGKR